MSIEIKIFQMLMHPARDQLPRRNFGKRKFVWCHIVQYLGLAESTVSHHLAGLRRAGLIACEKRGRWIYYFVDKEGVARFKTMIACEM